MNKTQEEGFNFDKSYSRKHTGSSKWLKMYEAKPNVAEGIIPMSVADMDFITSEKITDGLCDYVKGQILGYSQPTGKYKQTILNFFAKNHNYKAEEDWLITSPGIVPALYTCIRAYTNENDGVIIMPPVYGPFFSAIENQNRRIESCPLINNGSFYEIDFDLLEKLASKADVKLLLFCSPHNPGSRVWKQEELERVAKIACDNNLIVVSDEIHSDIVLPGHNHIVFSNALKSIEDRSIICTAASKSFNIAGLQCSNIFIKNEALRDKFVRSNEAIGVERANVLGMKATEIAYEEASDWLSAAKDLIYKHHALAENFFKKYEPKLKLMKAESTFLAWIDFSNLGIEANNFIDFLEEECDFFITEGSMFGEESKYFIRINLALATHKLEESLKRLEIGLKNRFNI